MEEAALISPSPSVARQISLLLVQVMLGKRGLSPGTSTVLVKDMLRPTVQAFLSGSNRVTIMTFGVKRSDVVEEVPLLGLGFACESGVVLELLVGVAATELAELVSDGDCAQAVETPKITTRKGKKPNFMVKRSVRTIPFRNK